MRSVRLLGPKAFETRRTLAVVIAAVFAAVAAGVNAAGGPLWSKLTLAGLALVLAACALIFFLQERAAHKKFENYLATAVQLVLLDGQIAITNSGPRLVWEIDITAQPALGGGDRLPCITAHLEQLGVTHRPVPDWMWFAASIRALDPPPRRDMGTGPMLVKFDVPDDNTMIEFRVYWTDHEGQRRLVEGQADVAEPFAPVELKPPQPWM